MNLLGLVLAVVCFIATYLYLDSLLRSDRHFPKADRTWVITQELWNSPTSRMIPAFPTPGPPVAAGLRADFPALEAVGRAVPLGPQNAATEDQQDRRVHGRDRPEFLEIFDLDFKAGDPAAAVSSNHSAIVTERTAERLFGTTQVLGRRILLQTRVEVTVTGVIAPIPQPSHMGDVAMPQLAFDVLVPMRLVTELKSVGGIGVLVDPEQRDLGQRHLLYVRAVPDGSIHHAAGVHRAAARVRPAPRQSSGNVHQVGVRGGAALAGVQLAFWDGLSGGNAVSDRDDDLRARCADPGHRLRELREPRRGDRDHANEGDRRAQGARAQRACISCGNIWWKRRCSAALRSSSSCCWRCSSSSRINRALVDELHARVADDARALADGRRPARGDQRDGRAVSRRWRSARAPGRCVEVAAMCAPARCSCRRFWSACSSPRRASCSWWRW